MEYLWSYNRFSNVNSLNYNTNRFHNIPTVKRNKGNGFIPVELLS